MKRPVRSSSTTSRKRCASSRTKRAAGSRKSAPSSARAARRYRSSTPDAPGRTATSAGLQPCSTTGNQAPIRPQGLLPFKVETGAVRETVGNGSRGDGSHPPIWGSRRSSIGSTALYVPYWTFDAHAVCPWTAEAGHYYYTTEHYRDNQGRSQTRQVRHVRWEPASGVVEHFFDDQCVPGTQGLRHDLLKKIEPFPTTDLVNYDTAYLVGFRRRALPGRAARCG